MKRHSIKLVDDAEEFLCEEDRHLLQGMQTFRVGRKMQEIIPVGCRGGGCGVCRIRIVSGAYEAKKMSRKHVSEEEQGRGIALACRVYPRSPLVVEVLASSHSGASDN